MMFASRMMRGFATFYGKHRIIASETSNIIFAKQMHHIAVGDASFDKPPLLCYNKTNNTKGGIIMKNADVHVIVAMLATLLSMFSVMAMMFMRFFG